MKIFTIIIITIIIFSCKSVQQSRSYSLPAEWDSHEAVWVGLFQRPGRDTVTAQIIKAIHQNVQVRINYNKDTLRKKYNSFFYSFGIDTSRLQWIKDSVLFVWMRDPGPLFLVNRKGQQKILDFRWNNYGNIYLPGTQLKLEKEDTLIDKIDERMGKRLGLPVASNNFVAEGGGIESNGKGVLMTIEETALQRNPGKTLKEIETTYLKETGSKKIIWLKRMTLHDKNVTGLSVANWKAGGANGHIDEVARFVNANTIVLAKIDDEERMRNPLSKIDYDILEENYFVLQKATDANGKPFKIIRFPYPDLDVHALTYVLTDEMRKNFETEITSLKNGDTLKVIPAVSYMNFMTTNGVVLTAKYWKEGMPLREKEKDDEVLRMMRELYPDRKIIQINPYQINRGGGGIHCATQQQPSGHVKSK